MNITGSPATWTVGESEYQITPLSDQASHSVSLWVRSDLMQSAYMAQERMRNDPDVSTKQADDFKKSIVQAALEIEWTDKNGSLVLRTDLGLARLLVESLRPTVASITQAGALSILKPRDEDGKLMREESERRKTEFWDLFMAVNDLKEVDPQDVGSGEKKNSDGSPETGGNLQLSLEEEGDSSEPSSEADADATGVGGC